MQFRLIYEGKLPSAGRANTRNKEKHLIRKFFHKQLSQLWQNQPILSRYLSIENPNTQSGVDRPQYHDQPGDLIKHGGDIDNRIKVLFDALRMPLNETELKDQIPEKADR